MNSPISAPAAAADICRKCSYHIEGTGCCHALARDEIQDPRLCTYWQAFRPTRSKRSSASSSQLLLEFPTSPHDFAPLCA